MGNSKVLFTKLLHHTEELLPYVVVAEVADASFVCVVHLTGGAVGVVLHLHTYLPVSFTEGYALQCQSVDILYGEEVVILGIAEYITIDTYML